MSPPSLHTLPPELHFLISAYLPLTARLAYKLTSLTLYHSLPSLNPSKQTLATLSPCAALALRTLITRDKERQRCRVCKQWYPNELFEGDDGGTAEKQREERKKVLRDGFGELGGPGMVRCPGGVCKWHRGALCSVMPISKKDVSSLPPTLETMLLPSQEESRKPGWYSRVVTWCMHCGTVPVGRERCGCDCEDCGVRDARIFVRYVDAEVEGQVGRFVVWKDEDGAMWVREWKGRSIGPGEKFVDMSVTSIGE